MRPVEAAHHGIVTRLGQLTVFGLLVATLGCEQQGGDAAEGLPATQGEPQPAGASGGVAIGAAGASGVGSGGAGAGAAGAAVALSDAGAPPSSDPMTAGRGGAATAAGAGGAGAAAAGGAGAASGGSSAAAAGSSGAPPASAGAPAPHAGPFTVYLAGDSTVSTYADTARDDDQAGWGQMLSELITPEAHVDNRAIGGRTARRFIDDGRLDEILQDVQTGDYVLVQFGTNDGNRSASYMLGSQTIPYYLEPSTDFKTYLEKYIAGVRDHDAIPVLVTPPPRNSAYCTGGNGTGAHAQAMRELAKADGVILVDLNQKSVDYLKAICPEPSPPNFYLQRADGTVDGTHFQERGARVLAGFVADGLREAGVRFVKPSK